jgi:hypothetical protein
MKLYLEELRVNSRAPDQDDSKVLVEVVQRLLSLQVSTEELIKMLEYKDRHFALFAKALDTVIEMAVQAPENLHEALDMFNFLFRKSNSLDYLMADYSGLPRTQVEKQITVLASLFKIILDFLCAERREGEEERILLSIESLKWLWRGKELPCVQQIDVHKIWGASMARLGLDPRFRLSLVDLCFILLKFCNEKSLQLNEDPDDMPDLSLKRHASVVDESSMAHILNQNFTFLITVLSEALQEFSRFSDVLTLNELEQLTTSRPGDISTNCLYDSILKAQKEDLPLPDSDSYIPQKRPFEVLETKTEEYEEMQEVRADLTEEERVVAEKEDPSGVGGLFDDPEPTAVEKIAVKKTRKIMNKSTKLDDLKQIVAKAEGIFAKGQKNLVRAAEEGGKVFAVFSFYVHSSPDMARLFFSHRENLELISSVAFGQLPEALVIPAVKIWEQLALILPANLLLSEMPAIKTILAPLVERSRAKYLKEKKPSSVTSGVLEAQRQLLSSLATREGWECISDEIAFLLKQDDGCKDLALDLLIPGPKKLIPGSLCFDTTDPVREQLLLLNTLPHLRTKAYLRDLLYYRYDITSDQEVSKNRADRFSIHQDCYLTVCLRTKNYAFIPKSRVSLFPPTVDKELYNKLLNKLDLKGFIETLPNSTSARIQKFAALSAIKLTSSPQYKPLVNTLLQSITPDRCNVFSEQELSTQLIDFIDFVSNTPGQLIQSQAAAAPSQIQKFKDLKARLYSNLRSSRAPAGLIEDAYWTSQFGIRGVKTDKVNFNIAYNKPSLDLDTAFDHARLECRKGWSQSALHNLINQAIYQTGLLYQFAVRTEEDRLSLVYPLAERLYLLSYRHSDLAEAAEVQIMLEIILEESTKESLLDLANDTMKRDFSEQSYPWELRLLDRLVRRLKNAEMAKQFYLYSIDQVIILTKKRELIERDNRLLNALVETVEKGVETGRLLGTTIEIEGERKAAVEEWFKCIDIPSGDRYSFKRTHKLEYLQNILLHFAFSMVEVGGFDSHLADSKSNQLLQYLKQNSRSIKSLSTEVTEDDIIKGIMMKNLTFNHSGLEPFEVTVQNNQPYVPLPQLKNYSHWRVMYSSNTQSYAISTDKYGLNVVKEVNNDNNQTDDLFSLGTFQVDKSKDYYWTSNVSDNFQTMDLPDGQYKPIVYNRDLSSPYLTASFTNEFIIIAGKIFWQDCGFHPFDDGVTCAAVNGDTNYFAYYKATTREIVHFHKDYDIDRTKLSSSYYRLEKSQNSRVSFIIDVSALPLLVDMELMNQKDILGIDETGAILLYVDRNYDHNYYNLLKSLGVLNHQKIFKQVKQSSTLAYYKVPGMKYLYFKTLKGDDQFIAIGQTSQGISIKFKRNNKTKDKLVKDAIAKKCVNYDDSYTAILTTAGRVIIVYTLEHYTKKEFDLDANGVMKLEGVKDISAYSTGLLCIIDDPSTEELKLEMIGVDDSQGIISPIVKNYTPTPDTKYLKIINNNEHYWLENARFQPFPSFNQNLLINYREEYPVKFGINADGVWRAAKGQPVPQDGDKALQDSIEIEFFYPFNIDEEKNMMEKLKEKLNSYKEETEIATNQEPKFIYCNYDFIVKTSPTKPAVTDKLIFCIEVIGKSKASLQPNIVDWLSGSASIHSSSNTYNDIYLVPDILNLPKDEFEKFKEENKDLWEPDYLLIKGQFNKIKAQVMEMMAKKLDDESYERAHLSDLFGFERSLKEYNEYNEYYQANTNPIDNYEEINSAFCTMTLLNYSWYQQLLAVPIFQGKYIDHLLLRKCEKSIFETFNSNHRRRTEYEDYRTYKMDRMRGLKQVHLKRQNFSLLTQLAYELNHMDSEEEAHSRHRRLLIEGTDFSFTGESKPICNLSWS